MLGPFYESGSYNLILSPQTSFGSSVISAVPQSLWRNRGSPELVLDADPRGASQQPWRRGEQGEAEETPSDEDKNAKEATAARPGLTNVTLGPHLR